MPLHSHLVESEGGGRAPAVAGSPHDSVGSSSFHHYSMSWRRRASYPCNFSFTAERPTSPRRRQPKREALQARRFFELRNTDAPAITPRQKSRVAHCLLPRLRRIDTTRFSVLRDAHPTCFSSAHCGDCRPTPFPILICIFEVFAWEVDETLRGVALL